MLKKGLIFAGLVIFLGVALTLLFINQYRLQEGPSVDKAEIFNGEGYVPKDISKYQISEVANKLASPTRLKITPDQETLLVTQITGELIAIPRDKDGWSKKPYLVSRTKTSFPGFPPDEAGLVGLAFSNNFSKNKTAFLLYNFKQKDGKVQNRINSIKLVNLFGRVIGINQKQIWQANVFGTGSHQITDAAPVQFNDEDRIIFAIGEGFDGKKAQDPKLDAGKILSIKEDGSSPVMHALGLRNGYVFSKNIYDKEGKFLISDTGPDKYDRLIYTNPLLSNSINLAWDGNQDSLLTKIADPNDKSVSDIVITRLPETKTFTGIGFTGENKVYLTLFGKTGSKENSQGKQILLGKFTTRPQPKIETEVIIERNPAANGFFGNPIGLEIDPNDNSVLFADIMEGKIYQISERR